MQAASEKVTSRDSKEANWRSSEGWKSHGRRGGSSSVEAKEKVVSK